jgi:hypothetical protein
MSAAMERLEPVQLLANSDVPDGEGIADPALSHRAQQPCVLDHLRPKAALVERDG